MFRRIIRAFAKKQIEVPRQYGSVIHTLIFFELENKKA